MAADTGGAVETGHAVHIGRQAIYDRAGDVVAYELLFRDTAASKASSERGSYATSQVIVTAFSQFGIQELVGQRPCFVNVTREFLVGDLPLPFDATQVGLEILSDVPVDSAVLHGVAALSEQGYTIAVDDFAPGQGRDPLLEYANYAKIDLLDGNVVRARTTVAQCRQYRHVQLIAQRLETQAMLIAATNLGIEFFQGHVLGRPHLVTTRSLGAVRLQRLQLLAELAKDDFDIHRIVALVEHDPDLAIRLLRLVNAAASGMPRTVASIGEAVVLTGTTRIRQWVTLMAIADVADGDEAQLENMLICARMCQLLAGREGESGPSAFTLGLLAAASDLLAIPIAELAAQLSLSDAITRAATQQCGPLAAILDRVLAYQLGDAATADLTDDYLLAVCWSTGSIQQLAPAGASAGSQQYRPQTA
ncbi:EAL and HDOD domain-containing protein [Dactylosporangium sp. NPDC051541]|uniref:EAL and HDOD domain-containing protein n=1 Tax=Dactylosporangium sp. NPDC051541 TaxID=3363977 RepID=UPI0037A7477C